MFIVFYKIVHCAFKFCSSYIKKLFNVYYKMFILCILKLFSMFQKKVHFIINFVQRILHKCSLCIQKLFNVQYTNAQCVFEICSTYITKSSMHIQKLFSVHTFIFSNCLKLKKYVAIMFWGNLAKNIKKIQRKKKKKFFLKFINK